MKAVISYVMKEFLILAIFTVISIRSKEDLAEIWATIKVPWDGRSPDFPLKGFYLSRLTFVGHFSILNQARVGYLSLQSSYLPYLLSREY